MRLFELKPSKPLTPQQARIMALKIAKVNATRALKAERARQKISKAENDLLNR